MPLGQPASIHNLLHIKTLYTECTYTLSKRNTLKFPLLLHSSRMSRWYVDLPVRSICDYMVQEVHSPTWAVLTTQCWTCFEDKYVRHQNGPLPSCVCDVIYNLCTVCCFGNKTGVKAILNRVQIGILANLDQTLWSGLTHWAGFAVSESSKQLDSVKKIIS